jgi:multidrug efflux system membrane fusion protein
LGLSSPTAKPGSTKTSAAVPVSVATVVRGTVPLVLHTLGTVEASASVAIKARVEGQVVEVAFRDGQTVEAGDLLFRLDPAPLTIALQEAEAALARDKAQLASAQADLSRYGSLSKKGYASTQQYEQATAAARALTATVAASQAQVEQARLMLGYTQIRAPMAGMVGAVQVDPGNLVKANGDDALVTLAAIQPVRVSFTLSQQYLPAVQKALEDAPQGIPADILVAAPPGGFAQSGDGALAEGIHRTGQVDFLAPEVDRTTGTVQLRATVANQRRSLLPGQYVDVSVQLGTLDDRLIVPPEALANGQHGPYVLVVDGQSRAQVVGVRLVYQDGSTAVVEPSESSAEALLQPEARVIVDGQVRVTPGALVAVKAPLPASALAERAQVNGEPVNGEPVRDQKAEQKP